MSVVSSEFCESRSEAILGPQPAFFQSIAWMLYIRRVNVASLDLNLLVALDALLQEESVSRGGQKIGLSQPAMSHALGKLRGLLADPLLVRTGGRMQTTPRAQSMRRPLPGELERVHGGFVRESFVPSL